MSLRYIPYVVPSLASLKLNSILPSLIENSSGLIIVSGPFGSGRSTTIAAMIEAINQSRKEYIISIEEPIEYIHTNSQSIIEQREVGRDTNSFKDALRYFEEENGDVLFLEEMSQPDIVPMVLEIARGNALVFTAISADSASNTISRILDLFPAYDQDRIRNLLATSLRAIVCQKVIPRIGGGVVVAQEILIANGAVKSIILGGNIPGLNNIIQTSRQEGMISFSHVLAELVKSRQISMEDALDQVIDKKIFESLLR